MVELPAAGGQSAPNPVSGKVEEQEPQGALPTTAGRGGCTSVGTLPDLWTVLSHVISSGCCSSTA